MSVLKGAKSVDNVFRIRRPGGSEKKQGALSVLSLSLVEPKGGGPRAEALPIFYEECGADRESSGRLGTTGLGLVVRTHGPQ